MGEAERILDHLEDDYTEPIRDPVWKHIYVSRELLRVVEQEQFQKLDRIRQLGPAYLVYPGATHTRRSHSLGVFHIARRMITTLVRKNRDMTISLDGVKAFLCAALLHDIGHYPFAHSLKDLALEAHEALAARTILTDFSRVIRGSLGIEPEAVASIIDRGSRYSGAENVGFYWKILSSVIDPDKLDYLNRDAFFCGVPYGIQDVDFILEELYPHPANGVAISQKGITALENILFSKYLMYKTVYWHKTVRIATAMIKKVVAEALAQGAVRRDELYGLDDEQFFARFTAKRFAGFSLIEDTRQRNLHKQVFRIPFDDGNPCHRRLEDIGERLSLELRIAGDVSGTVGRAVPAESIVVDVPERITFELRLPVIDPGQAEPEQADAGDASYVFHRIGHEDFPRSLRSISVSARREDDLLAALQRMGLARYFAA
jgi:HD superfamily phosphohydrolase